MILVNKNRLLCVILFSALFIKSYSKEFTIEKGILDLRNAEQSIEILKLDGEWAFYWNDFIEPSANDLTESPVYALTPSYWSEYKKLDDQIKPQGYASYRLLIFFPSGTRDTLCLKTPIFDSAFELYLNGIRVGGAGKKGKNKAESIPAYNSVLHTFYLDSDTLDIVLHVSNFHHRRGGFWKPIILGKDEIVKRSEERKKASSYAMLGILFGTFLLLIVVFSIDRHYISQIFFAITSLGMLIRLLYTDFYPANSFISIPWNWMIRLEYFGTYLAFCFGMLYLNSIFPTKNGKKIILVNTAIFALLSISVFFLKVPVFSYTILILETIAPLILVYFIAISFKGMLKRKTIDTIFFFTVTFFLFTVLNDTLLSASKGHIYSGYLMPLGFFSIIISQVIILLLQWNQYYQERLSLNSELTHINRNLEIIVDKRTGELKKMNERLKSSLEFKNKLFSIIAHDLKSPVTTIAQYTELMKNKPDYQQSQEILDNLHKLSRSSVSLIDNLIHWGRKQTDSLQYQPEQHTLTVIIEEIIELFSTQFKDKGIDLNVHIPIDLNVYCDTDLIRIVLRNILSNAYKFSSSGSEVKISALDDGDQVKLIITDQGKGMSKEQIKSIFNGRINSTKGTEGETGTGLGMQVTKELINTNKGTLSIESEPGKGTMILFTLPGKP